MMELKEVYGKYNHFFVSYKSADTIELAEKKKVYFLINPQRNPTLVMQNFLQSLWMFIKERPDIIITTGAGVALATCYIAKLFRKKIIFVETIARTKNPSLFGRLVYPIADLTIVQWRPLLKYYKKAKYGGLIFDFSKSNEIKTEEVKDQIFVIVGTHPKGGFERLLKEIDHLIEIGAINEKVIAQIGYSSYEPRNYEWFRFAPRYDEIINHIKESKITITHGGVGSIAVSLQYCKTTIAVAKSKRYDKFVDDHQLDIIKYLEGEGKVVAVYDLKDLVNALKRAETFKMRMHDDGVGGNMGSGSIIDIINRFIKTITIEFPENYSGCLR
jgi:UDP-N-acetylglucosamine transferase subunit ALG13